MSFCVSFPKGRSFTSPADLVAIPPAAGADVRSASRIVVRMSSSPLLGRWDDNARQTTVILSGTLTNVPEPFRPGTGVDAARTLADLYTMDQTQTLARIDGAFCAAILDWQRDTIILARDKVGIARAYLCRDGETVTFSDSLADLLASQGRTFDLDLDSVYAFLSIGWVPSPHSMFRNIEKLPAGTLLESRGSRLEQRVYYDVPHAPSVQRHRPVDELRRLVVEHLDRSVGRGLALGGRWGSFLSGGVDSSSVVAALGHATGRSFPTYFGGFAPQLNRYLPNPEEPAMSQLVADRVGANHHMLWLGPEMVETTSEIVRALEEPVCDGGCIVLGAVMRAARDETDGLMTGIGGDFLFTGERRHMVLSLLRLMRPVPDSAWRLLNRGLGLSPFARNARISQMNFDLTRVLAVRKLDLEAMYAGFFLQAEASELESLFLPEAHAQLSRDPAREMNDSFRASAGLDPLTRFLYLDLKHQTPEHCVREAETLGRHFGLTIYNPFLDAEYVDFAMSIPSSQKISGLRLKVPLKQAMRGRLPDEVLDRKKGGLGSPIRWWVTQPDGFVSRVLSRENIERRGFLSADAVERFRHATATGVKDYTKLLWSLFTLELWMQHFVDEHPGGA